MQTMLHVPNMVKELSESGGWGTLEGDRERRRVGSAAKVEKRQRREQAQRRNDSEEKNWQNRYPCSAVPAMNGQNEQQKQGDSDCDERNQEPTVPMLNLDHRSSSLLSIAIPTSYCVIEQH